LLVGLIRDANNWVYLGILMRRNRLIELDDFNIVYNINEDKRGTAIALRQQIQFSNIDKFWTQECSFCELTTTSLYATSMLHQVVNIGNTGKHFSILT
jgi:hypothetical protein